MQKSQLPRNDINDVLNNLLNFTGIIHDDVILSALTGIEVGTIATMNITILVPLITRLKANIEQELTNLKQIKEQIIKSGEWELAATVREWEKS